MPLEDFPENTASRDYDVALLKRIIANDYVADWVPVGSAIKGHTAQFTVLKDSIKIDGVRMTTSLDLAQRVADMLGCVLITPRVMDLQWLQRAVTIPFVGFVQKKGDDRFMATKAWLIRYNAYINAQLAAANYKGGIIGPIWKSWPLTNLLLDRRPMAINYGGYDKRNPYHCVSFVPDCRLIQQPSWAHDYRHIDYSQFFCFMRRECIVDNTVVDVTSVMQNKDLVGLVSHEGVLRLLRAPGVPVQVPVVSNVPTPPCAGPNCPKPVIWTEESDEKTSTDFGAVAMSGLALAGVIGAFALGMKMMGRAHSVKKAA